MRSKLFAVFIILLLLAAFFVVGSKTASACSLGRFDYYIDFHEKYRLVNFDDRNYGSTKSQMQKDYPIQGLYDIQTNKLLWKTDPETFRFPRDSKVYITEDGIYMVKVDLEFLPGGLSFYKEGVKLESYNLSFFESVPDRRSGCSIKWLQFEKFAEAEGKYYLETVARNEYVFSIFTGKHLNTIENMPSKKKQDNTIEFLSSPIFIIGSLLLLIFVLYVIDVVHLLRLWISRFK